MKILYPPRPKGRIPHTTLPRYEQTGQWVWQRKFNGTCVVVNISPTGEVGILNRHGEKPKLFSLSSQHVADFQSLNIESGQEYWLAGELLDHKTKDKRYKGKIVLFDVLQAGRYLMRSPNQEGRLQILSRICRNPRYLEPAHGIALEVTDLIWMAETWDTDADARFRDFLGTDEIEGLVLRKKKSVLDNFGRREYEVSWMLRCRKPHSGGNYAF
jgi:hypothetical protein